MMKIEYDISVQLEWIAEMKQTEELNRLKADWEAWKVRKGYQDGRYPYAKELHNGNN